MVVFKNLNCNDFLDDCKNYSLVFYNNELIVTNSGKTYQRFPLNDFFFNIECVAVGMLISILMLPNQLILKLR